MNMSSKRKVMFSEEHRKKFPCFRRGRNDFEAMCTVCPSGTYISTAYKGINDLAHHIASEKHKKNIQAAATSHSMDNYLAAKNQSFETALAAAEGVFAYHTVVHQQSFLSMDCTSRLISKCFKDSEKAKRFTCARTKAEAIAINVLSVDAYDNLRDELESVSFVGIGTDSSNHGATKLFPIVVQYYSRTKGLQTKALEMKSLTNESAETISNYLMETLENANLTSKCVAFAADNINTNFGGAARKSSGNNVLSKLKNSLSPGLYGSGCSMHILHNAVQHGIDDLAIGIDMMVYKIYSFFSIYTVRTERLKSFCEFVKIEYAPLLNHSKSRFLSLLPAVTRIIQQFEALTAFFASEEKPPILLKRFFENQFALCYLQFIESFMSLLHRRIALIEQEGISVVEVLTILRQTIIILRERFDESYLPTDLENLLINVLNDVGKVKVDEFKTAVFGVYKKAADYLEKWISPMKEQEVFRWMILNEVPKWDEIKKSIDYIKERTSIDDEFLNNDQCFEEFVNLKDFVKELHSQRDPSPKLAHQNWTNYFSKVTVGASQNLFKISEYYFAIPAHNANVERMFSLVASQWTDARNKLIVGNVKGLLILKYNVKLTCIEYHDYLLSKPELLKKIGNSAKYTTQK